MPPRPPEPFNSAIENRQCLLCRAGRREASSPGARGNENHGFGMHATRPSNAFQIGNRQSKIDNASYGLYFERPTYFLIFV
jgi:hypothetical protein